MNKFKLLGTTVLTGAFALAQPASVAARAGECAMRRRARGFTLVEVMLATVLLAGGLALAFARVRSAMAISQRGEQIAAQSERMRAVQALLRRQLASALRSPLEVPDPTREPVFFQGDDQGMQFFGIELAHRLCHAQQPGIAHLQDFTHSHLPPSNWRRNALKPAPVSPWRRPITTVAFR